MTKRLAFLLPFLLALTSCAPPPQTLPVARPRQAELAAVSLEPWGHLWPRIFTTDGNYDAREANLDHLRKVASYQGVLWTLNWPDYYLNPGSTAPDPFGALRGMNPTIAIIGGTHNYLIKWSGCGSPDFAWQAPTRCGG